ncbi:zinc finger protein 37 isoform X1 [Rhipicephalus sanguineus]|uniref:zinc finger protein 37 isoform X1 n=1 Tax=Rhipicephalus sanguineus TaxID=34632 RepID=UPI0020C34E56|nr:zinc finger protein 37 isoform X1 [Rhipicephalus sanguineus]
MDDARLERKRALARERQRRRRETHPELREKAAEVERQRRRAKADLLKKAAEARLQRRQANPQLRKKVAQAKRQRRPADPELRRRESEANRRGNPEIRKKEPEAQRNRRNEIAELCEKSAQAKLAWMAANLDLYRREVERNRERRGLKTQELNRSSAALSVDFTLGGTVDAVPPTFMQRNAAMCHKQSTSCEMGPSKSTLAKVPNFKVCRRMQTNELEGFHTSSSTPKVPLQGKAVFLVPTNSSGSSCVVQGRAEVGDATEGDCRIKMDTNTLCNVKGENLPTGNVYFVVSPYGCGVCSRSFKEVDALFSHVLACPWPEPFQCSLCSQLCASWGAARDHLAAHIKIGAVKCPLCNHMFGKYLSIRRHIQRQHVPIRPFVCNCCDGTFITKSEIDQHSRQCRARTHVVDKYMGSSEKCDSQVRSRLATTVYRCSVCPSAFFDRLVIARHMRVHLNQVQQSREGEPWMITVAPDNGVPAMDEKARVAAQLQAEFRARRAAAARRRRQQAGPESRAREAAAKRQRRQADAEAARAREAAAARRRRQADPEAARTREAAAKRRKRSLPEGQKKHPFDCGNHRSYGTRPLKVKLGVEASTQCFIKIEVAHKATYRHAISKATQAVLSTSRVSSSTQCDGLEYCEDTF